MHLTNQSTDCDKRGMNKPEVQRTVHRIIIQHCLRGRGRNSVIGNVWRKEDGGFSLQWRS